MKNLSLLSMILLGSSIYAAEPISEQEAKALEEAKIALHNNIMEWEKSGYATNLTPTVLCSDEVNSTILNPALEKNITINFDGSWATALLKQEAESLGSSALAKNLGETLSLKTLQEEAVSTPQKNLEDKALEIKQNLRNNVIIIAAKIALAVFHDKIQETALPTTKKAFAGAFLRAVVDINLQGTLLSFVPKTSFQPVVEFLTEQAVEETINPFLNARFDKASLGSNKLVSTVVKIGYKAYTAIKKNQEDSEKIEALKTSEEARINNNKALINYLLINSAISSQNN